VKTLPFALLALVLTLSGCGNKPVENEPNNTGGSYMDCVGSFMGMYKTGGYEATGMTPNEINSYCMEEYG